MSYVVGNAGLIKDPYVLEELERIQAHLKGLKAQPERPDQPIPNPPGDPENPEKPPETLGQRWMSGPWLIGADGAGKLPTLPSYPVSVPDELSGDQHNYALSPSTVILELTASSAINITGLRQELKQRRIVGILNRGGVTISIVNQSTSSEAAYRFDWGDTGDAGESVDIPTGAIVWIYYSPQHRRWHLFGVPFVGWENLPPSITPEPATLPPNFHWFSSGMAVNIASAAGMRSLGEDTPVFAGTGTVLVDTTGVGITATTGAVIGNSAGVNAAALPPLVRGIYDPIWTTIMRTGGSLADVRIWVVLASSAPTNTDDFGGSRIGFRYSSVVPDAGWVGVTRDGATQTVTASVAAIAISTLYKLKVRKAGTSVFFSVNDSDEVEATATLPNDGTDMNWYCFVFTNAAAAKALTWYRHNLRGLADP